MAKTINDIKQELGISNSSTIDDLLTLASQYKVFSSAEINNIKAISVLPLPTNVKDRAQELKQRFTDIVLNENKGQLHSINVRTVIILELLEKLNTALASYVTIASLGTNVTTEDLTASDAEIGALVVNNSVSMGRLSGTTVGSKSTTLGTNNTASGANSYAGGNHTIASGEASNAEGYRTEATNSCSHAEGNQSKASGNISHAEGFNTTAKGEDAHSEGSNTMASGNISHAEGSGTKAIGTMSHAEGNSTQAVGSISHAEGQGTIANGVAQHVGGKYNVADNTSLEIIGNGTSDSNRSNARKLDASGNETLAGDLVYNGNTSLTNKISSLENADTALQTQINTLKSVQNVVDLMSWAIGSLSQNGEDASSDRRVRSDLYKFENNVIVKKTNNEFKYNVFVFTKIDNTYTCISYDNFQKDTCILNSELYYRFVIGKKTNEKITVNEAKASLVIDNYYYNNKNTPKPVIVDTDWWTDSDDSMAIRTALWAEREGMIDILGFNINAVKNTSVTSLARLIDSEGRKNYAIGYDTQATDYSGSPSYHQVLIDNYNYYSIYDTNSKAQDSVAFYRRMLVSLPTGVKCNIISIGYLNSLSRLINSLPDKYSTLTGLELLKSKVDTIYIMGGNYPSGSENNFNRSQRAINSAIDIVNSDLLPVCIKFLGYEMASSILVGGQIKDTIGTDDLIYKCLVAHGGSSEGNNGRSSWDPLTTLYACYNNAERMLFNEIQGNNVVNNDGSNTFTTNPSGKHFYCTKKKGNYWYQYILNTILNLNENTNRNDLTRLSITPYYNSVITNDWIKYKLLTNSISITVSSIANNNNCKLNKIGGMSYKSENIWDEQLVVGGLISDGSVDTSLTTRRTTSYIKVIPNQTYYLYNQSALNNGRHAYYDSEKNLVEFNSNGFPTNTTTITIPNNVYYLRITLNVNYGTTYLNDICINVSNSSINGNYYPYFDGIRDTAVTSVVSNGANLWDEEWENAYLNSSGEIVSYANRICSKNYIKVMPNVTYFYGCSYSGRICFYDSGKNYISYADQTTNTAFTTPVNCYYILFSPFDTYGTTYNHDIMLVKGSTAPSKYLPYVEPKDYPIASEIQALEGYGMGVNSSVYNYIDYEAKKFVKKVGRVDLGTLSWVLDGNGYFRATVLDMKKGVVGETFIKCSKYDAKPTIKYDSQIVSTYGDKIIVVGSSVSALRIVDTSSATAEAFKTAMSGVYLYYELATPVETDVSAYISTNVLTTATSGTISFNNTYSQKVPVDIDLLLEI